jgi:hypothetical protein
VKYSGVPKSDPLDKGLDEEELGESYKVYKSDTEFYTYVIFIVGAFFLGAFCMKILTINSKNCSQSNEVKLFFFFCVKMFFFF